jgi:integrase
MILQSATTHTQGPYQSAAGQFLTFRRLHGVAATARVSPKHVAAFLACRVAAMGLTSRSVGKVMTHLKHGLIARGVVWDPQVDLARPRILDVITKQWPAGPATKAWPIEVQRLKLVIQRLDSSGPTVGNLVFKTALLLSFALALRGAELLKVTCDDVTIDGPDVWVRLLLRKTDKASAIGDLKVIGADGSVGDLRLAEGADHVQEVARLVRELTARRPAGAGNRPFIPFVSLTGLVTWTGFWKPPAWSRRYRPLMTLPTDSAAIISRLTPHGMRAGRVNQLLACGASEREAQIIGSWRLGSTTMQRHYVTAPSK